MTRRAAAEPFGPTNGGLTGASRTDLLPAVVDRGVRPDYVYEPCANVIERQKESLGFDGRVTTIVRVHIGVLRHLIAKVIMT